MAVDSLSPSGRKIMKRNIETTPTRRRHNLSLKRQKCTQQNSSEPSFVSPPPSMETESNNILHISEDSNLNFDIVWDDRPSITTPNSNPPRIDFEKILKNFPDVESPVSRKQIMSLTAMEEHQRNKSTPSIERKRRRRWSDNNCTESLTRLYSLAATLTTTSGNVKPSSSSSSSPPTTSGKNIDDDQESLKELLGDSFLDHSSLMQLFTDSFDDSPTRDCNLSPRCVTPPPQNILCSSQHQSGESKISRSQTHSSSLIPKPDSSIIQPHTHSGITHSNTSVIPQLKSIGQATSEEDKASIPHLSATVKPNVLPEHHHTQSSRLTVNSNAKHNPPSIRPLLPQPNGSATNRTSNIYHNRNPSGMNSQSLHSRLNLHSRSSILNPDSCTSKLHSSRAVPFTNPKGSSAVASRFKAKEVSSSGQWKPQERPNSSNNEKDIESESEDEFWTKVALSVDELEQGTNSNNVTILDETTVDVLFKFDDNIENTKSPKQMCSQEDIERKKLQARRKLQRRYKTS